MEDDFKNAVLHWVVGIIYLDNNDIVNGKLWRDLAKKEIAEFVENHDFANTERTITTGRMDVYQYTDDIPDMMEPRDV